MNTNPQGQLLGLPAPAPAPKAVRPRLLSRLRDYFLAGLLVTAPISITIYLTWSFISWVDASVLPLLPEAYNPENYLRFNVPGIGLVHLTLPGIGLVIAVIRAHHYRSTGRRIGRPAVRRLQRANPQSDAHRAQHLWRDEADLRNHADREIRRVPRGGAGGVSASGHVVPGVHRRTHRGRDPGTDGRRSA